ncbi:hypothetical protein EXS57_01275 [Candidatus Kaiserbacteria bacterium]|nr:hypothetical protein [Candidatus Kaiserbacteria bacterium]
MERLWIRLTLLSPAGNFPDRVERVFDARLIEAAIDQEDFPLQREAVYPVCVWVRSTARREAILIEATRCGYDERNDSYVLLEALAKRLVQAAEEGHLEARKRRIDVDCIVRSRDRSVFHSNRPSEVPVHDSDEPEPESRGNDDRHGPVGEIKYPVTTGSRSTFPH